MVETLTGFAEKQGLAYIELHPPEQLTRPLPVAFGGRLRPEFLEAERLLSPAAGVVTIPYGRVLAQTGAIITSDDRLIGDVSSIMFPPHPTANPLLVAPRLPVLRHIDGTVAVLTAPGSDNYFHWLFDVLPRLGMLEGCGIQFDRLVAPRRTDFQRASLELLGVDPALLIDDADKHIEADRLLVPTLPGVTGNPPSWVCDFLRKRLLPGRPRRPSWARRLYVSRANSRTRLILNETEVWSALTKRGFERVRPDEQPLEAQAILFDSAEMIVGAHGAAFANLVFCREGAKVIELFSPNYVNVCYWALASQMKLDYRYQCGTGPRESTWSRAKRVRESLVVDVDELERTLDSLRD